MTADAPELFLGVLSAWLDLYAWQYFDTPVGSYKGMAQPAEYQSHVIASVFASSQTYWQRLDTPHWNFHNYYPELADCSGGPETIKPNMAGALIHCWGLIGRPILETLAEVCLGE